MDCPQNIQLIHEILPIVIPSSVVVLFGVACLVGYLIYDELTKVLGQVAFTKRKPIFLAYTVAQNVQVVVGNKLNTNGVGSPSIVKNTSPRDKSIKFV